MSKVSSFIIFDFETGGLVSSKNAITELAAIGVSGDEFKEIGKLHQLIYPYEKEYDQKALDVTGISMALLEDEGVDVKLVAKEMEELMKASYIHSRVKNAKSILVGHNVVFDIGFLHQLMSFIGNSNKILEKYLDGGYDFFGNFQPRYIDTMNMAKQMWGNVAESVKDWKLQTTLDRAGVDLIDAHRAMNDVIGTKDFFIEGTNKVRNNAGESVSKVVRRFRDHFRFNKL